MIENFKGYLTTVTAVIAAGAVSASAGTGHRIPAGSGTVGPKVVAVVPVITLAWTPNSLATRTVIVSATDLLTPPPWPIRASVINSVTNAISFPKTNACEFFRAYSE
jgi:hypothetical protein